MLKKFIKFWFIDDSLGFRAIAVISQVIAIIVSMVILAKLEIFYPFVVSGVLTLIILFGGTCLYWRGRKDGRQEMMEDDD